jgi:hypothetical protein
MALLGFKPCGKRLVLLFEPAQPSYVGAVRGAHHVGQHVNVAERAPHDGVGRRRMAQDRPIGARYVAARERVLPILQQPALVIELRALPDRRLVPAIKRLVDELAAVLRPRRKRHRVLVQRMVIGRYGVQHAELDHEAAQFGGRQAGADDRAMHARMQVAERRAPAGGGRRRHREVLRPAQS